MKFKLAMLLISFSYSSIAQDREISGKVTNAAGQPLAYSSIRSKNTHTVTFSSFDGSYTINVPDGTDSIIFSHANYLRRTTAVEKNNIINTVLQLDVRKPVNLAITGTHRYSKQEKERLKFKPVEKKEEHRVMSTIEMIAEFPGGTDQLQKYLAKYAAYPDSASISDVHGTVTAGFTINADGSVGKVILIRGVNKFADKAVLDALKKMPKWIPGLQNGSNTEYYGEVSVTYDITGVDE